MPRQCEQNCLAVSNAQIRDRSFSLQYPPSPTESSHSLGDPPVQSAQPLYQYSSMHAYARELSSLPTSPPAFYSGDQQTSYDNSNPRSNVSSSSRVNIAHPYARLYAKKEGGKRRKIWNHALEKSLFNPYELSTVGAPHRRTIYMASLEAHVDRLHAQLLSIGFWPVAFDELEPFKGLNSKTAKSMVAGLQHDASYAKLKLLELERANNGLRKTLQGPEVIQTGEARHSPDSSFSVTCNYPDL